MTKLQKLITELGYSYKGREKKQMEFFQAFLDEGNIRTLKFHLMNNSYPAGCTVVDGKIVLPTYKRVTRFSNLKTDCTLSRNQI
jgi:hypothetical protein